MGIRLRMSAAAVAVVAVGWLAAWNTAHAGDLDYAAFREQTLVQAIVEADLAYLSRGSEVTVTARKLFGVELYARVAERCAAVPPDKRAELRALKWNYLSAVLLAPGDREAVLESASHAVDDADTLVRLVGCGSGIVNRILDEITG